LVHGDRWHRSRSEEGVDAQGLGPKLLGGVQPYSADGGYVNFMMDDEGETHLRASYGGNFERLAALKAKYDPTNLFRCNQNIRPRR